MPPKLPKTIQAQQDAVEHYNNNVNAPTPPKTSTANNIWNRIVEDDGRGNIRPRNKRDELDNKLKSSIEDWMSRNVTPTVTPQVNTLEPRAEEPDYTEIEKPQVEAPRPVVEPSAESTPVPEVIDNQENEPEPVETPTVTTVTPNKADEPKPLSTPSPQETFDEWTRYLDQQEGEAVEEEQPFVEPTQNVPESNYVQPVTNGGMVIPTRVGGLSANDLESQWFNPDGTPIQTPAPNTTPTEEVITPYQPTLDVETQQDIYDWFMNGQNDYLDQIEEERQLQEDLYNTQYYGENWREILEQEEADRQAEYRDYDIQELRSQALDNVRDNQEYTDAYNDLINQHLEELGESVEDLTPEELDSITQQTEAELEEQGITPTTFEDEYQKLLNEYNLNESSKNAKPRDEIDPIAERLLQSETNQRVEARRNADEKAQRGAIANQLVDMGYTPDQAAYLVQHMNDDGTIPQDAYQYVIDNPNGLYTSDREIIWEPPSGTADNPNDTLDAILRGDFWIEPTYNGQAIPEGTELYNMAMRGNAERALRLYDQGENGGFSGLVIPTGFENFIASTNTAAIGNLDNVRINEDGSIEHYSNPDGVEYVNATAEEYQAAIEAVIQANPPLLEMLDKGLVSIDDIMNHFFKGLNVSGGSGGSGGYGNGYGYGGYRGYGGGGRGYGGYGGYSSPYRPNDTARNQEEQRINNIMKNWTF